MQKSLKSFGDKISADDKAKIEAALKDAEGVVKSDNKERSKPRLRRWPKRHKLAEQMYAQQQPEGGAQPGRRPLAARVTTTWSMPNMKR